MAVERLSPCKVNLLLNILGQRADGFHELETILQPLRIYDRLEFERINQGIELSCNLPALPTDASNLVYRAARIFFQATGLAGGVRIYLEKHIPLAAGLGGGSANAACTLLALNDLFDRPLATDRLYEAAANLGSDIPFFLQDRPALGTGRGERVQPLSDFPALKDTWVMLIHPGFGVSTPWAYQNLARFPAALKGQPGRAHQLIAKLQSMDLQEAAAEFYNALEFPVLAKYPVLALYQEFLLEHQAILARMSGSGSTTFGIFKSQIEAEKAMAQLRGVFGDRIWTILTLV